jgi:hypothetical protein
MSTAVVPFSEMERMAITVAKSNLFGMKTPEQALTLMALSQAEGIHPMIAVRDYHIINGRPSLKADTMLARFQQAGGKVEWHELSDSKAEATFSHAQGGSVKIDWTMERATRAGLAKKDVWIGYARAMLRSRVISEGIRTVFPGVIAGVYTPEEAESIDPMDAPKLTSLEKFESVTGVALSQEITEGHLSAISSATTVDSLKRAFQDAYKEARDLGDDLRMRSFTTAYEARKSELTSVAGAAS